MVIVDTISLELINPLFTVKPYVSESVKEYLEYPVFLFLYPSNVKEKEMCILGEFVTD